MIIKLTIGILSIIIMMSAWIGVQSLWRKVFFDRDADEDVLARRSGCGDCGCSVVCSKKKLETNNK